MAHEIIGISGTSASGKDTGTAAANAIVCAAGGTVVDTNGRTLTYSPTRSLLNPHFVAKGVGRVCF